VKEVSGEGDDSLNVVTVAPPVVSQVVFEGLQGVMAVFEAALFILKEALLGHDAAHGQEEAADSHRVRRDDDATPQFSRRLFSSPEIAGENVHVKQKGHDQMARLVEGDAATVQDLSWPFR
jgi:hypothetical protein